MFLSEFDADGCGHRVRNHHGATSPLRLTSGSRAESMGPQDIASCEGRSESVNSSGDRMCSYTLTGSLVDPIADAFTGFIERYGRFFRSRGHDNAPVAKRYLQGLEQPQGA